MPTTRQPTKIATMSVAVQTVNRFRRAVKDATRVLVALNKLTKDVVKLAEEAATLIKALAVVAAAVAALSSPVSSLHMFEPVNTHAVSVTSELAA